MTALSAIERLAARWHYPVWPLCVVALLLLSLLAAWPLFGDDLHLTGDTSHAIRIHQMRQCLGDSQLPCRWTPDLGNGYGYPLFNYYPPLPYYTGALLHELGFSYLTSANLLAAIGLAVAGLSMYTLARRFWGELGGLVSGVAYLFAPYLALDVYLRGAIAELWGLALLPLLFLAVYELIVSEKLRWLPVAALTGALLLLSHNLVALVAAPALVAWAAAFLWRRRATAARPALVLGLAGWWSFGLAAFFTLPVLFEGDLVQIDSMTRFPFNYASNFASATDLLFLRSDDYSFLLGGRDEPPVQIGWFHWALAAVGTAAGVVLFRQDRRLASLVIGLFAAFFAVGVFMSVSASEPFWDSFGALRFLQFPWRYMGLVSFAAAMLAGASLLMTTGRQPWLPGAVAGALVALLAVSGLTFFDPYKTCDVRDDEVLSAGIAGENDDPICETLLSQPRSFAITDYLPNGVREVPPQTKEAAFVTEGPARIVSSEKGSEWLELQIDAPEPSTVDAALFDFPNWRVWVDGERVEHRTSVPYGLIRFDVPQGRHQLELRLEDTNVRRLGNVISLISWTALILGVPAWWLGQRLRRSV